MGLIIHQEKINRETAEKIISVCPFGAISYDGRLSISPACKMCKLCVKKGPAGAVTFEEDAQRSLCDKSLWCGIAVYAEQRNGKVHPVSLELVGKARELSVVIGHPVYALLIGSGMDEAAKELLHYGVDKVFTYDDIGFENFVISPYAAAFTDFIEKVKPSSILVPFP